jgi:hypothetical protein
MFWLKVVGNSKLPFCSKLFVQAIRVGVGVGVFVLVGVFVGTFVLVGVYIGVFVGV